MSDCVILLSGGGQCPYKTPAKRQSIANLTVLRVRFLSCGGKCPYETPANTVSYYYLICYVVDLWRETSLQNSRQTESIPNLTVLSCCLVAGNVLTEPQPNTSHYPISVNTQSVLSCCLVAGNVLTEPQ